MCKQRLPNNQNLKTKRLFILKYPSTSMKYRQNEGNILINDSSFAHQELLQIHGGKKLIEKSNREQPAENKYNNGPSLIQTRQLFWGWGK